MDNRTAVTREALDEFAGMSEKSLPGIGPFSGSLGSNDFPVPKPSSPDDVIPQRSEERLITAVNVPLFIPVRASWSDGSVWKPFPVTPSPGGWPDPPFPQGAQIAYRAYWSNDHTEVIDGPQDWKREVKVTPGQSDTDSTTLSLQLGVKVGDLSAKLSASFQHTVVITRQEEVSQTYSVSMKQGQTGVWTRWHLVEVFAIADQLGEEISWAGSYMLNLSVTTLPFQTIFSSRIENHTRQFRDSLVTFAS